MVRFVSQCADPHDILGYEPLGESNSGLCILPAPCQPLPASGKFFWVLVLETADYIDKDHLECNDPLAYTSLVLGLQE